MVAIPNRATRLRAVPKNPTLLERQYARIIYQRVRELQGEITSVLIDDINRYFRRDALPLAFIDNFGMLEIRFNGILIDAAMAAAIYGIGKRTYEANAQHMNRVFNFPISETVDRSMVDDWFDEQIALIRSLAQEQLDDARSIIEEGATQNIRNEVLAKRLQAKFGVAKWRAKLIARDQISKLNGKVTRRAHREANVSQYVWTTVGDERVRKSHKKLDGTLAQWDSPPLLVRGERLHPTEDIQCRCFAYPYLPQLGALGVPSNLRTA